MHISKIWPGGPFSPCGRRPSPQGRMRGRVTCQLYRQGANRQSLPDPSHGEFAVKCVVQAFRLLAESNGYVPGSRLSERPALVVDLMVERWRRASSCQGRSRRRRWPKASLYRGLHAGDNRSTRSRARTTGNPFVSRHGKTGNGISKRHALKTARSRGVQVFTVFVPEGFGSGVRACC